MQAAGPFWREAGGDPKFISVKREVPTNAREDHTGLQRNYLTKKNKKNDPDRLEMNKYCRFCRKHTLHRETR